MYWHTLRVSHSTIAVAYYEYVGAKQEQKIESITSVIQRIIYKIQT